MVDLIVGSLVGLLGAGLCMCTGWALRGVLHVCDVGEEHAERLREMRGDLRRSEVTVQLQRTRIARLERGL